MKSFKLLLTVTFLSLSFCATSQVLQFERIFPDTSNLAESANLPVGLLGSISTFDMDSDQDLDLFFVEQELFPLSSMDSVITCYRNLGLGKFEKVTDNGLQSYGRTAFELGDFNNDGHVDVLLLPHSLMDYEDQTLCYYYVNDGTGYFELEQEIVIPDSGTSRMVAGDMNNDGYEDFISATGTSKRFYLNNEGADFILADSLDETGGNYDLSLMDYDDDGYLDLVHLNAFGSIRVYINDEGSSIFSDVTNYLFSSNLDVNNIEFADVDGDGDQDWIVIASNTSNLDQASFVYINQGDGEFIVNEFSYGVQLGGSDINILDIDNDNDMDVILNGVLESSERIYKYYLNDGEGNFQEGENIGSEYSLLCNSAVGDFDLDGDHDIVAVGEYEDSYDHVFHIYERKPGEEVIFEKKEASSVQDLSHCTMAVGDIDGDGDEDLFFKGVPMNSSYALKGLYLNDGNGDFELQSTALNVSQDDYTSPSFVDIDNDGDLDFVRGKTLYLNDGLGNFEIEYIPSNGTYSSWYYDVGDIDNDGFIDIAVTGELSSGSAEVEVFRNNGDGTFESVLDLESLEELKGGTVSLSDFNGDNFDDLLVTGEKVFGDFDSDLYLSLGDGTIASSSSNTFMGFTENEIAVADLNGDGQSDVFICGPTNEVWSGGGANIFLRNSSGSGFIEIDDHPIPDLEGRDFTSAEFADFDNDGDQDLFVSGKLDTFDSDQKFSAVYVNDGEGNFEEAENMPFWDAFRAEVKVADFDGDNKLDIIHTGISNFGNWGSRFTHLYKSVDCYQEKWINDNICSGAEYAFADGVTDTLLNDTTRVITLEGAATNGCDSVITEIVQVHQPTFAVIDYNLCFGEEFTYADGNVVSNVTSNESRVSIIENSVGCDSVITEHLYVPSDTLLVSLCMGSEYMFADSSMIDNVQTDTTYVSTLTGQAASGCDSLVTEVVEVLSVPDSSLTFQVCEGETYTFVDGTSEEITEEQAHTSVLEGQAANGCDSLVIENIEVLTVPSNTLNHQICPQSSFTFADGTEVDDLTEDITYTSTFTGQAANGCDSIVIENIDVPVSNLEEEICYGEDFTFVDGETMTNLEEDIVHYSLLADQAENGCDSLVIENLIVHQIDTSVDFDSDGIEITSNQDNAAYTWLDCDGGFDPIPGASDQIFTASENGSFAVEIEFESCVDTSECVSVVYYSVEDMNQNQNFRVFPNPTSGLVYVKFDSKMENVQVTIRNLVGQVVRRTNLRNESEFELEINGESGVYFLEVDTAYGRSVFQVIKN